MECLGFILQTGGPGLPKDVNRSFKYLLRADKSGATTGHLVNLGNAYLDGAGVESDPAMAFRTFMRGAELGDRACMSNVAFFYGTGSGVKRDNRKAERWQAKAAK